MRVLERRKHASSVLCEYSCIPLTEFRALGRPWYLTNPVLRQSGTTAFIHSSFLVIFCLLWFDKNSRLSLYSNSNVEPFLVIFLYLVFFARQWSLEKFAILSLKPRSNARILNTERGLFFFFFFFFTFLRTEKSSFNYLLIDPRVTQNLPVRAKKMDPDDVFRVFVMAIFYVGKGKRSRPYAHLNEALQSSKVSRSNQKCFSP